MTRIRASLIHLGISVTIGLLLGALVWFVIYPPPILEAIGGDKIFAMLLGIDVILGPILTLLVYKAGKRTLKFDLSVIALLQIAAMIYGLSFLWAGRPVYFAAIGHRFDLVQAMDVQPNGETKEIPELPPFGPKWVGTEKSKDPKRHDEIHTLAISGIDYGHYPEFHVPIEKIADEIKSKSKPLSELKKLNPGRDAEIDEWLGKRGAKAENTIFQGMRTRGRDLTVFMDASTAKVIGIGAFLAW
jgi:hypothetical protein